MNKLAAAAICALCLLLFACGNKDKDLQQAQKVFDQYCEASIVGDTDTLVELTSSFFRAQYAKQPPVTNAAVIAVGKAFSSKSQYKTLAVEQTADDKIAIKAQIAMPDIRIVLQKLEATINPAEMSGLSDAEVQTFLARKMINILQNEAVEMVTLDALVEMVKEDGLWKVNFPVNMNSVM